MGKKHEEAVVIVCENEVDMDQPTYIYYKKGKGKKLEVTGPFPDDGYPIPPGTELSKKVIRLPYKDLRKATEVIKGQK